MSPGVNRESRPAAGAQRPPAWALDALLCSGLAAYAVLDGDRVEYASPAFCALVGMERPASLSEFVRDADFARFPGCLANGGERYCDVYTLRGGRAREGCIAFEATQVGTRQGPRIVLVATDVSAWMRNHARLQRLAFEDALTGLANRALLHDRIEQAIASAQRRSAPFAVMLIDLDRFKPINDLHGHATGDLVLRETARRLQAATRAVDTVARLGGDEFVVLLGGDAGRDQADRVVGRIIRAVSAPLETHGLQLGISIGIAMYPDDGADADHLLAQADAAMYDAKGHGGNGFAFAHSDGATGRFRMRLAWLPQYRIGLEAIDAQHEQLVDRIDALWEASRAGQDHGSVARGLAGLIRLLEAHFATEESHMAAHPYAGADAHRADHQRALETARRLAARIDEPSVALGIRWLYDWLLSHIRTYDAELPRVAATRQV